MAIRLNHLEMVDSPAMLPEGTMTLNKNDTTANIHYSLWLLGLRSRNLSNQPTNQPNKPTIVAFCLLMVLRITILHELGKPRI